MIRQAPLNRMIDKAILIQSMQNGSLAVTAPRALQHLHYALALRTWLSMQQEWQQYDERGGIYDHRAL